MGLSIKQQSFLKKYLPIKIDALETPKESKEQRAYTKKHDLIFEYVRKIPDVVTEKKALVDALTHAEDTAATGDIPGATAELNAIAGQAKIAAKKAEAIAKERAKREKQGKKLADKMRNEPMPAEVSAPVEDPSSFNKYKAVDRIAAELSRQSGIVDQVESGFAELNAELKRMDPRLALPQTPEEKDFLSAATDIRGQAMKLSNTAGREADWLEGPPAIGKHKEVDKELAAIKKNFDKQAADVQKRLDDILKSPHELMNALENAQTVQQDEKWRAKYETERGQVDKMVIQLEGWEASEAAKLRIAFDKIAVKNPPDLAQAVGDLAKLRTEIEKAQKKHKDAFESSREDADKAYKLMQERYVQFAKSKDYRALSDKHKAHWAEQRDMINNILSSGLNMNLAEVVIPLIDEADRTIDDLKGAKAHIDDYKKTVKTIEGVLGNKTNMKIRPEHNARLNEKLEKLTKGWEDMPINDALKAAKDLLGEAAHDPDSYAKLAVEQANWRKDKLAKIKTLEKKLKDLDKVVSAMSSKTIKKFEGDIFNDIEAAKVGVNSENVDMGGMDDALDRLEDKVLGWVNADPDDDAARIEILTDHHSGVEKAEAIKREGEQLKADYKQMQSDLSASKKKNDVKDANKEYKDIASFLKNASKLMKDPQTYDQARAIIDRARSRMQTAEQAVRKIPVGDLVKVHEYWKKAVDGTNTRFLMLIEAVVAKDDEKNPVVDKTKLAELKSTFEAAKKLLDPDAFMKASALYSLAASDKVNIREAREETLRRLRILNEIIANDPVLRAAHMNPFAVGGVLKPVYDKIRDFEYKALIGI